MSPNVSGGALSGKGDVLAGNYWREGSRTSMLYAAETDDVFTLHRYLNGYICMDIS